MCNCVKDLLDPSNLAIKNAKKIISNSINTLASEF